MCFETEFMAWSKFPIRYAKVLKDFFIRYPTQAQFSKDNTFLSMSNILMNRQVSDWR